MVARDTPGIAIGGLSGGEAKEEFCKVYVDIPPISKACS
jgi:thymidylate synthase